MLSVYDLTCNGMCDPRCSEAPFRLSWRIGSDRTGADQATYHVVVTSLGDGSTVLDTGVVPTSENALILDHMRISPDSLFVWFVEVTDDGGESACSVPAVFGTEEGTCVEETCAGILFNVGTGQVVTSTDSGLGFLMAPPWSDALGLTLEGDRRIVCCPNLVMAACGVRGSLLVSRGLVCVGLYEKEGRAMLDVSVPPGVAFELVVPGLSRTLPSGCHTLRLPLV